MHVFAYVYAYYAFTFRNVINLGSYFVAFVWLHFCWDSRWIRALWNLIVGLLICGVEVVVVVAPLELLVQRGFDDPTFPLLDYIFQLLWTYLKKRKREILLSNKKSIFPIIYNKNQFYIISNWNMKLKMW